MTDTANQHGFDIAVLMASEFHELKNQLGHLTLVLGDVTSEHPESAPLLAEPRLICQRIAERLVQVLTLYKSGVERLDLNIEAQSPSEFLDEIAAQAAGLAGERLKVSVHADAAPPFWFFDRYLVEMALLNAVHNALQYARGKIELSAEGRDDGLVFMVRDDSNGCPIKPRPPVTSMARNAPSSGCSKPANPIRSSIGISTSTTRPTTSPYMPARS